MAAGNLPWETAIRQILQENGGAMHYADIAEKIVTRKLRKSVGANPSNTVATYLSTSLREGDSPYIRVGRGEYALQSSSERTDSDSRNDDGSGGETSEAGALRSFGMFWQRALVHWKGSNPKILDKQPGGEEVNFADQIGIYLLHDRHRVIYVGRAANGISVRLLAHTNDRLGGRWDRFSWFGLRGVTEDGVLKDYEAVWTESVVIDTMEALLIEGLEPPLNRKRGDNFSGVEYLQVQDPSIRKARKQELIKDILAQIGEV